MSVVTTTVDAVKSPLDTIIEAGAKEYQIDSWRSVTGEEWYWWIKLLTKRATSRNRSTVEGTAGFERDIKRAGTYLIFFRAYAETLDTMNKLATLNTIGILDDALQAVGK